VKRAFKGNKRIAKKLYKRSHGVSSLSKNFFDFLSFVLSLKEGDVVGSCFGFNEIVDKVSYSFENTSLLGSPFARVSCASEILVYTKSGKILYASPLSNDVYFAFSKDEIVDYWKGWVNESDMETAKKWNMFDAIKTIERIRNNEEVCDERGCFLT
jgi:hypothetical protein